MLLSAGLPAMNAYLAKAQQVGSDAVFTFNPNNILTSKNVNKDDLTVDNFHTRASLMRDVGGDLTSDVSLRNQDGTLAMWQIANGTISQSAYLANPGVNWRVIGTGDLNGALE